MPLVDEMYTRRSARVVKVKSNQKEIHLRVDMPMAGDSHVFSNIFDCKWRLDDKVGTVS